MYLIRTGTLKVPAGRPPGLTPEIQESITEKLRTGVSLKTAAAHANVGLSTLYRWMQRAKRTAAGDQPFREFREACRHAQLIGRLFLEERALGNYRQEHPNQELTPREALEILGRRWKDEWGKETELLRQIKQWWREEEAKKKGVGNGE